MAASSRPVTEIQIGGHAYRVQTSADALELARLVEVVEGRLTELPLNQRNGSRSLVLVALSLAHDLEQARREYANLRADVVARLTTLVARVDTALDHRDENGELLPPLPNVAPPEAAPHGERAQQAQPQQPPTQQPLATDPTPPSPAVTAAPPNDERVAVTRRTRSTPGARQANDPT